MAISGLTGGVKYRISKMFARRYQVFDIGWFREKQLKHQSDLGIKAHWYKKKYKVQFRDAKEFLVSIDELFINEFYKFKSKTDRPRIIDCGSYIGTSILYFKVNYPNAVVTGYEPDASNFDLLQRNLDNWAFDDTRIERAAIWINNDGISFHSAGNMSSGITATSGATRGASEQVRTVRLRDLLDQEVDFLKIDIEGAELPVLKDCSDKLRNVRNLFVEYHGKYTRPSELNEILDILLRNGFSYCVREGSIVHPRPFWDKDTAGEYDMLLNIFAFRD